jgi:hypothetical protein
MVAEVAVLYADRARFEKEARTDRDVRDDHNAKMVSALLDLQRAFGERADLRKSQSEDSSNSESEIRPAKALRWRANDLAEQLLDLYIQNRNEYAFSHRILPPRSESEEVRKRAEETLASMIAALNDASFKRFARDYQQPLLHILTEFSALGLIDKPLELLASTGPERPEDLESLGKRLFLLSENLK